MGHEIIIGREYEQAKLAKALASKKAEFVAVYGRRRVGKTYLIRNVFLKKKCIFFQCTGIKDASQLIQIKEFTKEIARTFYKGLILQAQPNWMDVFEQLTHALESKTQSEKIVLFFDEFPWMASKKTKLLQALDYYWNRFWVSMPNLKIIICGSTASWIVKNILNNKGGLHNRTTLRLPIEPFSLKETHLFLKNQNVRYNDQQILELYMCLGGIPYYLSMVEKGLSAIQNINQMCFQKRGTLLDEFNNLFSALFTHAEIHRAIIEWIATKREGMSREEIESKMATKGGRLTNRLQELEYAGFITSFTPWGHTKKGLYYKVIDEYTLFYLHWIAPTAANRITQELDARYWEEISKTQAWKSWSGYAFEAVCYKHIDNIKRALQISDGTTFMTWRYISKNSPLDIAGAQIDLLFDRNDGVVNICEIKYRKVPYKIDREYAMNLKKKEETYKSITKTQKQIFLSIITPLGLVENAYSDDISSVATLDDLFLN